MFTPMIEPHPETKQQLTGWREPSHAYILFETLEVAIGGGGTRRQTHGLMTLNVEHRPDVGKKLQYYLTKGFRVIHYANFPRLTHQNPKRAQLALLHKNQLGQSGWDELEGSVRSFMRLNPNWETEKSEFLQREVGYEQQIRDLQAAINGRSESGKRGKKADSNPAGSSAGVATEEPTETSSRE